MTTRHQFKSGEVNPPRVSIRMPSELKSLVSQVADQQRRSENDVMVEALQRGLSEMVKADD